MWERVVDRVIASPYTYLLFAVINFGLTSYYYQKRDWISTVFDGSATIITVILFAYRVKQRRQ
jgi:hypothetical protein